MKLTVENLGPIPTIILEGREPRRILESSLVLKDMFLILADHLTFEGRKVDAFGPLLPSVDVAALTQAVGVDHQAFRERFVALRKQLAYELRVTPEETMFLQQGQIIVPNAISISVASLAFEDLVIKAQQQMPESRYLWQNANDAYKGEFMGDHGHLYPHYVYRRREQLEEMLGLVQASLKQMS